MASTAADIIASAKAEAEAAKQSAIASLSGMGTEITNAYNTQQAATTAGYQNQLNELQNAYNANAKAAYGNYMSDKQQLNNQLVRLGLQNTGYGVSQGLLSAAAYSKNLAGLQSAYDTNRGKLGIAEQQALADLYSNYAKNKLGIDQYIYEAGQNAYNNAYKNTYQAKQDEIANALQAQYYSYLMSKASGGGDTPLSNGGDNNNNNTTLTEEDKKAVENKNKNASGVKGVTSRGKELAKTLSYMVRDMKDVNTAAATIQKEYNAGNITAEDVRYITNQLGLK